jgi:hypothetical protein
VWKKAKVDDPHSAVPFGRTSQASRPYLAKQGKTTKFSNNLMDAPWWQ